MDSNSRKVISLRETGSFFLICTYLLVTLTWAQSFRPDFQINEDDYTVLLACDASYSAGMEMFMKNDHRKFPVKDWKRSDQFFSWEINLPQTDDYVVNVLLEQRSANPIILTVECADSRVQVLSEFRSVGSTPWIRLGMEGNLRLALGTQTVTLTAHSLQGDEEFDLCIHSLELVRPDVADRLHKSALKMRSQTGWLIDAKYGFMVHWTQAILPRGGEPKPYSQAVQHFDVASFANQMQEGGAGFVVLTTTHGPHYFPAPLKSLDRILPGRTSQRDLIADLITALDKRGIKLMLYYHLGANQDPDWLKASGFWDTDCQRFFDNWKSIIREVGERYGHKLMGWWFDDGILNYYYRSAPWEQLSTAAKAGNPQRLIAYNAWIMPSATEFQDYHCGEGLNDPAAKGWLPMNGNGRYIDGSYKGLQACATLISESDWGHWKKNTDIGPPRWDAEQMATYLQEFISRKNVPIFNLEIYQEGVVSPTSIEMFHKARRIMTASGTNP